MLVISNLSNVKFTKAKTKCILQFITFNSIHHFDLHNKRVEQYTEL